MNTKRHKRQSKKVKRKTKTYKKRSIRKYGGGEGEIYLKSSMYHGFSFKPVYKFIIIKEAGKGGNAQSNLGKISCNKDSETFHLRENKESCIQSSSRNPFHSSSLDTDSEETHLSQTLQNMYKKTNPEGEYEKSFPYNKEYILRVYGKNLKEEGIEREIHGTEYHKELSQTCSSFVCTLFDYGKIVDKKSIYDWNESVYTNLKNVPKKYISKQNEGPYAKCKNDENCVYALLEKGEMDMMKYFRSIKMEREAVKKILYIVAMKMIRNIYCLHRQDIMHYDIKFENCVFFPKGESKQLKVGDGIVEEICNLANEISDNDIKLIDFGYATKIDEVNALGNITNYKGTPGLVYNHSTIYEKMNGVRYQENEENDIEKSGDLEMVCKHSRFADIFAILKDIASLKYRIPSKYEGIIFEEKSIFDFKSTKELWYYEARTSRNDFFKCSGSRNLPPFLNKQRILLEKREFSDDPYQNILNKLKEEYLALR